MDFFSAFGGVSLIVRCGLGGLVRGDRWQIAKVFIFQIKYWSLCDRDMNTLVLLKIVLYIANIRLSRLGFTNQIVVSHEKHLKNDKDLGGAR